MRHFDAMRVLVLIYMYVNNVGKLEITHCFKDF